MSLFSTGQSFIEGFMIDECLISRDEQGVYDDVLDEETGELVQPDPDVVEVYSGACLLKPMGTKDQAYDTGDQPVYRKGYNVLLPKEVDDVRLGDVLTMTTSVRDPALEGYSFRVFEVRVSTHSVYRHIRVEDIREDYNSTRAT